MMERTFEVLRFLIAHATRFISPSPVAVEWILLLCAVLAIAALPLRKSGWTGRWRAAFVRVSGSKRLAIAVCGLFPVVVRLAMLPIVPVPDPSIHDEFSHLLLADTLAHGRLTNPTPPQWESLETIHVIQRPTYNSMYPPAHASLLAAGQLISGNAWAGVVLGVGLMCAAICWMMQGWLPRAWAFYGSLLVGLKIGIVGLWMNSYLNCATPAIGGALLVGALPRIRRSNSAFAGLAAALGVVILMNSRPFEGAVLTVAGAVWIAPAFLARWGRSPSSLSRMVIPGALLFIAGLLFTGYYCWRVTGSPTRMPYQVNRDSYGWPENLGFLPAKTVELTDPILKAMYTKEVRHREIYSGVRPFLESLSTRLFDNWTYFLGPVLTIPLLFLPRVVRDRRTRPLVFFLLAIAALNLLQMVLYPYHLAPVVGILFIVLTQGIRHMYVLVGRLSRRRSAVLALCIPICLGLVGAMKQQAAELQLPLSYWERAAEPHREARAEIVDWLSDRPGKHLVIVRYAALHSPDQEWVYNLADIDNSRIVWAREKDPAAGDAIVARFPGRLAWLLEADVFPLRVVRYGRPLPPICPTGPGPSELQAESGNGSCRP